jgi:hypothetical protein
MRALLVAMEAWVRDGTAPPESRFPRLVDGTLVDASRIGFRFATSAHRLR